MVGTLLILFVGEENNPTKKNMFSGRWYESFKWKPPEQNTIDFRVEVLKDDDGKSDKIQYNEINGKLFPYKTLILKISYSQEIIIDIIHVKY